MSTHLPVLRDEVSGFVNMEPDAICIDGTFGRGGHASAILEKLGACGVLYAFDRDPAAISSATELAANDKRLRVRHSAFSRITDELPELAGRVSTILLDVGTSSPQLDDSSRGFSFRSDGPLDMRMDTSSGVTAAEWLATASEEEIADTLYHFGEERRSRRIAASIVEQRRDAPITTTTQLAELIRACVPRRGARIDAATRSFQALRIRVNDELGELDRALDQLPDMLCVGGRLLVIAFHSLEDRMVKQTFRALDDACREARREGNPTTPLFRALTRKPVMAGEAEKRRNPRARSARLRVLERVV